MGIFKKGYKASREEKERQDKEAEDRGKKLFDFFMGKGEEEADIHFLTQEPVNFYNHNHQTKVNGADRFDSYTCTNDDDCVACQKLEGRPSYKGAYLVVDQRPYTYTDKKSGKEVTVEEQIKLYTQGMKVVSQLDRINTKRGDITQRDMVVVRLGTGTSTTYSFEPEDEKSTYTSKEIENMLPEQLREMYDGTEESLYDIIEEQLMLRTMDFKPSMANDSEDDEDEDDDTRSQVIGAEDEEQPKRKMKLGGKKKRANHSIKPKNKKAKLILKR